MAASKSATKKYFTAAEANATLPLVRAIVRDITALARDLRDRHERLARVKDKEQHGALGDAYQEELQQVQADFERDKERMVREAFDNCADYASMRFFDVDKALKDMCEALTPLAGPINNLRSPVPVAA